MCLLSKKYTNDGRNLIIMSPFPIAAAAVHRIGPGTDYRRIANTSAKSRNIFFQLEFTAPLNFKTKIGWTFTLIFKNVSPLVDVPALPALPFPDWSIAIIPIVSWLSMSSPGLESVGRLFLKMVGSSETSISWGWYGPQCCRGFGITLYIMKILWEPWAT